VKALIIKQEKLCSGLATSASKVCCSKVLNDDLGIKKKALNNRAFKNGRSAGARTLDPLIKSQLLYQLSYASIGKGAKANDSTS
jgi:hypothetical protein